MSLVLRERSHCLQAVVLKHSATKFGNETVDVLLQIKEHPELITTIGKDSKLHIYFPLPMKDIGYSKIFLVGLLFRLPTEIILIQSKTGCC